MANHKSAIKRQRQNEIRRLRNRTIRTRIRSSVKAVLAEVELKNTDQAKAALAAASREIRKAGSKGVYKANTVSRKVSRLTKLVNKLEQAG